MTDTNLIMMDPFQKYQSPYPSSPVASPQQTQVDPFEILKSPYQSSPEVSPEKQPTDPFNVITDVFQTDVFQSYQVSGVQSSSSPDPAAPWNPLDDLRNTVDESSPSVPLNKVPMVHFHSSVKLNYDQSKLLFIDLESFCMEIFLTWRSTRLPCIQEATKTALLNFIL